MSQLAVKFVFLNALIINALIFDSRGYDWLPGFSTANPLEGSVYVL